MICGTNKQGCLVNIGSYFQYHVPVLLNVLFNVLWLYLELTGGKDTDTEFDSQSRRQPSVMPSTPRGDYGIGVSAIRLLG